MAKQNKLFQVNFPGRYMGGTSIVWAVDKASALRMVKARANEDGLDFSPEENKGFDVEAIPKGGADGFVYYDNGDY